MPSSDLPPHLAPAVDPNVALASAGSRPLNVQKTMLGVAIPGIAPLSSGAAEPVPAPSDGGSRPAPVDLRSNQSTMLGVAAPGIAPAHGGAAGSPINPYGAPPYAQGPGGVAPPYPAAGPHIPSQGFDTGLVPSIAIVPRPKTLIEEALPEAPRTPEKRGVPAVAVVAIVFAVVAVIGGIGAFYALRTSGPLTVSPQLDDTGRESLKIHCATCPNGTTVALGASTTTVTDAAAILPLPAPLSIGKNDLVIKIDRPGASRDEDVKVHVPVAYRVRADLSTLSAKPPAITVCVEATEGTDVKVEGQPVALDEHGRGAFALDVSAELAGEGEAKAIERTIAFSITPKGEKPESGVLVTKTAIVPLALDAPGSELFTDKSSAAIAGQTRPNGTVTIDGQAIAVDAQGRFGVRVELAALGPKPLEIVASAPTLAPRVAKVRVVRVTSLDAAAKEQEAASPITFETFGADPSSSAGKNAVVEGEVIEIRAGGGHSVLLVEDRRGCAKGASCLVRVVHGEEDKVARGDSIRAYGRVLGAVTSNGKALPDLEASIVLPIKAPK